MRYELQEVSYDSKIFYQVVDTEESDRIVIETNSRMTACIILKEYNDRLSKQPVNK